MMAFVSSSADQAPTVLTGQVRPCNKRKGPQVPSKVGVEPDSRYQRDWQVNGSKPGGRKLSGAEPPEAEWYVHQQNANNYE